MDNDLKFEKYSWDSTDLQLPKVWYQPKDYITKNNDLFVEVKGTWTAPILPNKIYEEMADYVEKKLVENAFVLPSHYIINKGATILFWKDGTKTIVKKSKNEKFEKRLGFLTAYFQKHCGMSKTKANKFLDNLEVQE